MTGQPIRVLICEDHQVVAEALASLLDGQADIRVVGVTATVNDVVSAAVRLRPDVVLMDYLLPDGDGAQATAQIKAGAPQVKVVVLTSFANEDALVAAVQAGCSGFVTKHRGAAEVTAAVRAAADGEAIVPADMLSHVLTRIGTANDRSPRIDLTPREREVLQLLGEGESKEAIGERLFVSTNTVRNHIQSILTKLGVHSRLEAVAVASREGLIHRP